MSLCYTHLDSCVLRVSGEDARAYLQGQCTADLRLGSGHHALWLNRKGRVLAYTIILVQTDESWLLISPGTKADELKKIISANLIADDVVIEDQTTDWQTGVLWGEGVPVVEAISLIPTAAYGVNAWNVLARRGFVHPWVTANSAELEETRIRLGVPSVPADCGQAEFPQECGLDNWVSYTKGCYLGQEVMARIQSMGSLRRVLRCVESARANLLPGLELRSIDESKVLGVIKSSVGRVALALVPIDLAEGTALRSSVGEVHLGKVAKLG